MRFKVMGWCLDFFFCFLSVVDFVMFFDIGLFFYSVWIIDIFKVKMSFMYRERFFSLVFKIYFLFTVKGVKENVEKIYIFFRVYLLVF